MQLEARAVSAAGGVGVSPLVVAHRGAWNPAPQNSLSALQRAIDLGCDAIELDVRRTRDGRLVVIHDARLGGRPVSRLTLAQVRERLAPGQAPLLADMLAHAAGRILVDVELKEDGYVAAAVEAVVGQLGSGQFVITSFRDGVLAQVKRHAPQARTGLLLGARRLRDLDRRVQDAGVDFVAPHVSLATTTTFAWAAERGLPIWTWTANDPRILRVLTRDCRVEAVITDRPARALAQRSAGPGANPVSPGRSGTRRSRRLRRAAA